MEGVTFYKMLFSYIETVYLSNFREIGLYLSKNFGMVKLEQMLSKFCY